MFLRHCLSDALASHTSTFHPYSYLSSSLPLPTSLPSATLSQHAHLSLPQPFLSPPSPFLSETPPRRSRSSRHLRWTRSDDWAAAGNASISRAVGPAEDLKGARQGLRAKGPWVPLTITSLTADFPGFIHEHNGDLGAPSSGLWEVRKSNTCAPCLERLGTAGSIVFGDKCGPDLLSSLSVLYMLLLACVWLDLQAVRCVWMLLALCLCLIKFCWIMIKN